ncbi:MAG: trypsin-like peptidase domain-containing protein [Bacteroidia bacterium]|nr:trypsin-like peptidase domain-containing protein [Bacteroidia bacterium]
MNKTITRIALFALIASTVSVKAQISQGGIPVSFNARKLVQEIPVRVMPRVDIEFLKQEDELNKGKMKPYRFGANIDVDINLQNAGLWETLPNGDRIWRLAIRSEGALSLNFLYNKFFMPTGGKFFIYSEDHQFVLGAFTSENNREDQLFATDLLPGNVAVLEYIEPKSEKGNGVISINQVVHGYRDVFSYLKEKNANNQAASGACNVNINCPQGDDWQTEKRAVCILVVGGSGFCTGSMINDVPQSGTPYFLTANHCTSDGSDNVAQWIFRFNYESSTCSGTTGPTSQSITGSVYRAHNAGSDFALLELSSAPPASYNAVYAGWSREGVVVDSSFCIHHPSGDIKKISKAQNQTVSGTYSNIECWRVGQWTLGVTEPGSSGSPLFDPNHRIIGQLYGGPSACGNSASQLNDYYGKFSVSWDAGSSSATRLKEWLDPQNLAPLTVDTYDPNAIAYTLDGSIQSVNAPGNGLVTCTETINPVFTFKNNGSDAVNSALIQITLNGVPVDTVTYSGPSLASGASTTLNVPALNLNAGSNAIGFNLLAVNGVSDENSNNNSRNVTVTLLVPSPVALPIAEGFQAGTFPSAGYSIDNDDADITWERTTLAGGFGNSSSSAKIAFFDYQSDGAKDNLNLPYADFTNLQSPVVLTFDVAYARYSNTNFDSLNVLVSADCGGSWTYVYQKGNTQLATNGGSNVTNSNFVPSASQWRTETINLDSYIGSSSVLIRFQGVNGYGNDLYLDNINLRTDSAIGLEDLSKRIDLYPNPGSTIVEVHSTGGIFSNVQIRNIVGEKIINSVTGIGTNAISLDCSNWSKGFYFFEMEINGQRLVKKFVKE